MSSFFLDPETGVRYYIGVQQVTIGDRLYVRPTAQTYLDAGLIEVSIDPRPDDRFYVVGNVNNDGTYNFSERSLPDVQATFAGQQETTSRSVLAQSDHVVLEALEAGGPVPADYASYRASVRAVRDANIALIDATASIAELEALVGAQKYVLVDPLDPSLGLQLNTDPYLDTFPLSPDALAGITGTITFHRSGSNLVDGLFRDAAASDPDALTLSGVAPYELTLRLVTNDITLPYVLPEGFKETAGGLGSGTQDVELKYGNTVLAIFSLTTGTGDKIFNF